jgi:hypothetical protein
MITGKVLIPDINAIAPVIVPTTAEANTIATKTIASPNPVKSVVHLRRLRKFIIAKPSSPPT